jgi:hypothetical protein
MSRRMSIDHWLIDDGQRIFPGEVEPELPSSLR